MATIAKVAQAVQDVFSIHAVAAARESKVIERVRAFTPESLAKTFVLTWLGNPQATLDEMAQTAAICGTPVSPQAVDQRFTPQLADFFQRLLEKVVDQVISADPVETEFMRRFNGIYVLDSSLVSLPQELEPFFPGCGGGVKGRTNSAMKLQFRFNLSNGELLGPLLGNARGNDYHGEIQTAELPAGSLRVADLGYFACEHLCKFSQDKVYWLTRLLRVTAIFDIRDEPIVLWKWLQRQKVSTVDMPVKLGARHRLPCRLLATRVPPQVVRKRRKTLREQARNEGRTVTAAQLEWTRWTILVTNVPPETLTLSEALTVCRARWQIELLIKLFKQSSDLAHSRGGHPWRILAEIFAKLIGQVIQHWLLLVSSWKTPHRSLTRAAKVVRNHAIVLVGMVHNTRLLRGVIKTLQAALVQAAKLDKRRKKPNHRQLFENPDLVTGLT